jgi:HEAT repeat protein
LGMIEDTRVADALLPLLKDENPAIRLHAVRAASRNWNPILEEPIIKLFSDSHAEIWTEATSAVMFHQPDMSKFVALANDPDPHVCVCAISILARAHAYAIPRAAIRETLKKADPAGQGEILRTLSSMNRSDLISRADLLPILSSPRTLNIQLALRLIEGRNQMEPFVEPLATHNQINDTNRWLKSFEAAPLVNHRFAEARLIGLRILRRNADAKAIEMTLPLLRDKNPLVRNRAFATLKAISGLELSDTDPAIWEEWARG